MQQTAQQKRPFGIRDKLAYAAGDLGCNMSFALKGTILPLFWTQFMGLDALWLFPLLTIIVNVWDAINDPLLGSLIDSDRRQYRMGKFKTYIWFGSIGLIIAGALCFLPFPNAPKWAKIMLFIGGYVLWDAFYTIANVPYGSMMSLISEDGGDRAQLSAWRSIGSIVGNMLPMVILPFLVYEKVTDPATGEVIQNLVGNRVFIAAIIMGLLGFACFQFMIKNSTLRVDENSVKVNEDTPKFNVFKAMWNFCKNRAAVGATVAAMAMFIGMQGTSAAVAVLFQTYFKKAELSGLVAMFSIIPMFAFMPFLRKIVDKWGKQEAAVVGSLACVLGGILLLILPIKPNMSGIVVYILCQLIYGTGLSVYTAVSWSLMADAIDYNELKNGAREEGIVYSLHSFFRKLAQGVGPAAILSIMGALGYVGELEGAQTMTTATNMRWLVAALYAFSAILMFVALTFIYNLNKKKVAEMTQALAARHATQTTELPPMEVTPDEQTLPEEIAEVENATDDEDDD